MPAEPLAGSPRPTKSRPVGQLRDGLSWRRDLGAAATTRLHAGGVVIGDNPRSTAAIRDPHVGPRLAYATTAATHVEGAPWSARRRQRHWRRRGGHRIRGVGLGRDHLGVLHRDRSQVVGIARHSPRWIRVQQQPLLDLLGFLRPWEVCGLDNPGRRGRRRGLVSLRGRSHAPGSYGQRECSTLETARKIPFFDPLSVLLGHLSRHAHTRPVALARRRIT